MLVKTRRRFKDLEEKTIRKKDEEFEVTKKRFEEINSTSFGILVEKVKESNNTEEFPKHTGGGWYELSNGEKIKGKEEANNAENELEK